MDLKKYDYVSFDIFGTLISRSVSNPHIIFDIVEKNICLPEKQKIAGFAEIRRKCELIALKKIHIPSINDIYDVLRETYPDSVVDAYKKAEIKCEIDFCIPNYPVIRIYRRCIEEKKKVIIISDMYLSRDIIEEMLKKCGVLQYEKIYISSVIGCSKHSGKLYSYVVNDLGIKSHRLLHIGDNLRSDFLCAKLNGVHGRYFYSKEKRKKGTNNSLTNDVVSTFLNNRQYRRNEFEDIGYCVFGPLLYGFTRWMQESFINENIDYVLFLSRDGYLMQIAYEKLAGISSIGNSYFYASRRLLLVPSIWISPDLEDVLRLMYLPQSFSIGGFLKAIGMKADSRLHSYGLSEDMQFSRNGIANDKRFRRFYQEIKNDVIQNSRNEFDLLVEKLKELGIEGKKVAIVDVGWNGNMQKCLEKIIFHSHIKMQIAGFYLGVNPKTPYLKQLDMKGYIYSDKSELSKYYQLRFIDCIFELFFLAPHGSAIRYVFDNGKIEVKLKEFEYRDSETLEIFTYIQKGALEFIENFKEIGAYIIQDEPSFSKYVIEAFTNPTYRISEIFGDIYVCNDDWEKLASPKHLIRELINPQEMVGNFIRAIWKPAYLKRMIPLPINYGKVLAAMYGQYENIRSKRQNIWERYISNKK